MFALDMIHVAVGILIVILAILAFLNPEDNMILFPVIFMLAGLLNLLNGLERFKNGRGQKKKRAYAILLLVTAGILFVLCMISAATIWWR